MLNEDDYADDHDWVDEAECDGPEELRNWYAAEEWWLDAHADDPPEFILTVSEVAWASNGRARGPIMITAPRFERRRGRCNPGTVEVCMDSGAYTELSTHGRWRKTAAQWAELVVRVSAELGTVRWASIQDWMCEPWIIHGGRDPSSGRICPGTKLSVAEHQARTIESYLELRRLAPEVKWLPVVQGYTVDEYLEHVELYARAGVHLATHQLVGVGSVCRRNRDNDIGEVLSALWCRGLRLHGFGVKAEGLRKWGYVLRSTDSEAWSLRGRMSGEAPPDPNQVAMPGMLEEPVMPKGRDAEGRRLSSSQAWAEEWRIRMEADAATGNARRPRIQPGLF